MGYELRDYRLYAKLERHNGPGDIADDEAWYRFEQEVNAMIDADPDYSRIFNYGRRVSTRVA